MRTAVLYLLAILSLPLNQGSAASDYTNRFEKMTTLDGKEFTNVRPRRIEEGSLVIFHSKGIANVDLGQLPDDIRSALGMKTAKELEVEKERLLQLRKRQALARQARDRQIYAAKLRILAQYHAQGEFRGYNDPDQLGRDMRALARLGSKEADALARELGH
jgi:hypothetical protein